MRIASDWHIHTSHSCDEASLLMEELPWAAAAHRFVAYGVTDHIHTLLNLPDLIASREAWEGCNPPPHFHFGVEVSCVSQWELDQLSQGLAAPATYGLREGGPEGAKLALALTPAHLVDLQIEYVIGGTHWPMYVPLEREALIRDFHRQNMFLATHPLVNIVAHPWWWHGAFEDSEGMFRGEPWLGDFGRVPQSLHDEFAAAAVEHRTAVEVNLEAMLLNDRYPARFRQEYMEYLAGLHERGVTLSLGSDCHSEHYDIRLAEAEEMLDKAGLGRVDWWVLEDREEPLQREGE
jgi:histidinol phosphatase-like PHP family hydrolase